MFRTQTLHPDTRPWADPGRNPWWEVVVQINLVCSFGAAQLGVEAVGDGMALIVAGGTARLIYSEAELNRVMSLSLGPMAAAVSSAVVTASFAAPVGTLDPGRSIAFQDTGTQLRAFLFDSHKGVLTASTLSATGAPGPAVVVKSDTGALKGVETFAILGGAGGETAVLSTWNQPGLQVFRLSDAGGLTHLATVTDTEKSYVATVSDTASVTIAGQEYLLALSALENGITCYAVGEDGATTLVDSLGNRDMLAVSGPAALQVMQVGGVTYAVIAATGSSSLSVVRVNDMGCLFQTDHLVDDRTTRFDHTAVLDSFALNGRSFVVTAGTDAGITVLEVLPGGRLQPFATGVFETGAGLFAVKALEVTVSGTTARIFVVDDRSDRVQQFDLSLANLGGVVRPVGGQAVGTARDDLVLGTAAAETLSGGSGDDWIHSGGGADVLIGGAGADVFVFAAGSDKARINGLELGIDRIDLSDWGHVYSAAALSFTSTATGCVISLGGLEFTVVASDSRPLTADSFTEDDFLF